MKIIKRILVILVVLIALIVVVGFFMPGNVETTQQISIKAKPEVVFAHLNNLRNWDLWAKWNQMDPNWQVTYTDPASGSGAGYDWESEDPMVGAGSMTINESLENQLIKARLDFRDWSGADMQMELSTSGDNTTITWSFVSDQAGNRLFDRYMNLFLPAMLEEDLMAGLTNLKALTEAQNMVMHIEELPEVTVAYVPTEAKSAELTPALAGAYGAISQHLIAQEAEMTAMPMANYLEYKDELVVFEPMIPINKTIEESESVKVKTMPQAKMAVFYHYGDYSGLSAAHEEALKVLETAGIQAGVASLEIYETDPGLEPDPNKWLTKICFRIE